MAQYVLGQSRQALERLTMQAELLEPITARMLCSAGIGPGMRVLDIGCGAGDSTFQAARLVGPTGCALGLDRAAEPVAMAQRRAEDAGLGNVEFRQGTEVDLDADAPFDAIVGRYVLMYQPDPADFVRRLAARLRPGGTLALHEVDCTRRTASTPPMAELDRMMNGILDILRLTAADPAAAIRMAAIFAEAGLSSPSGFCERPIGLEGHRTFFRWISSGYALLQPRIAPGTDPVDIDGLATEFLLEVASTHGWGQGPDQWCVWSVRR